MPSTRSAGNTKTTTQNGNDVYKKSKIDKSTPVAFKKQRQHEKSSSNEILALLPVMHQLLQMLKENDDLELFTSVQDNDVSIESLQQKLEDEDYADPKEFKEDIDRLFQAAFPYPGSDTSKHAAWHRMRQFAESSLHLEAKRLGYQVPVDEEECDKINSDIALFRPTPDGFVFTRKKPMDDDTELELPPPVQKAVIHPVVHDIAHVPSLGETVPSAREPMKPRDKRVKQIQWIGYGSFSSFAPVCDSTSANVSYQNTFMGRAAKRFRKRIEKRKSKTHTSSVSLPKSSDTQKGGDLYNKSTNNNGNQRDGTPHHQIQESVTNGVSQDTMASEPTDVEWLKDQGLDADSLVGVARDGMWMMEDLASDGPHNMNRMLEQNKQLFEQLMQYQDHRFGSADDQSMSVSDNEKRIAKVLEKRLAHLTACFPPSALVSIKNVETALDRLPIQEPITYKGTLAPEKMFAFPSDKPDPLPPYANITPAYPKERWRIVGGPSLPSPHPGLFMQQPWGQQPAMATPPRPGLPQQPTAQR